MNPEFQKFDDPARMSPPRDLSYLSGFFAGVVVVVVVLGVVWMVVR